MRSQSSAVESEAPGPVLFRLASNDVLDVAPPPVGSRPVPDVAGLPLRLAVRRLHEAGFHVRPERGFTGTVPAAGASAAVGSLVRLGIAR